MTTIGEWKVGETVRQVDYRGHAIKARVCRHRGNQGERTRWIAYGPAVGDRVVAFDYLRMAKNHVDDAIGRPSCPASR